MLSISLFLIIGYGLSFIVDLFVRYEAGLFEQVAMRLGFGTLFFTVTGLFLDFLSIPLNIWVFLALSLIFPGYYLFKRKQWGTQISIQPILPLSLDLIYAFIVFVLFLITLFMYISGAFAYPYLENGDPWLYAAVSKQISEQETIKASYNYNHVSEPYAQGYQILMAIIHQSNHSIQWTMKVFHNLIISLSILFFYFFARELFNEDNDQNTMAFIATITLFSIPSWVSHFIFPLHFNMALLPVFLYALLKTEQDSQWKYIAGLSYGSILFNHFFTAFVITIIIICHYILRIITTKSLNKELLQVIIIGITVNLFYWVPSAMRHPEYIFNHYHESHGGLEKILHPIVSLFSNYPAFIPIALLLATAICYLFAKEERWFPSINSFLKKKYIDISILAVFYTLFSALYFLPSEKLLFVKGTASRVYEFKDFFQATMPNMINNPIGWGPIVTIVSMMGFVILCYKLRKGIKDSNYHILFSLHFVVFFFYSPWA